ncbi:MAG TPA: NUDIX domain-containing protein [Thermomicrobiales bacterium]|nr:NUDIX domain-containing protein [Thermomicrobiales bacterium]
MPRVISNVVDTYVFRKSSVGAQFLVLRKRGDDPAGDLWQSIHSHVASGETAIGAARRDLLERTGLTPARLFTADYIGQFYDHVGDTIVLAPTLAALVDSSARVTLSADFVDYAWCDLEETTSRLLWTTHRWAVRHIYDVIVSGDAEAELYAI